MSPNKAAQSGIPDVKIPDSPLQISFKHLECDEEKYALSNCTDLYWSLLAKELKRYAAFSVSDFQVCEHGDARHTIDPKEEGVDTAALKEISEELEFPVVWQFGLGERWRGLRVIGILVDPVFFVVHLDPNHQTYTEKAEQRGW